MSVAKVSFLREKRKQRRKRTFLTLLSTPPREKRGKREVDLTATSVRVRAVRNGESRAKVLSVGRERRRRIGRSGCRKQATRTSRGESATVGTVSRQGGPQGTLLADRLRSQHTDQRCVPRLRSCRSSDSSPPSAFIPSGPSRLVYLAILSRERLREAS